MQVVLAVAVIAALVPVALPAIGQLQRGGLVSKEVTQERQGPSPADTRAALLRAPRSACERGGPLAEWARPRRGVRTAGTPDWGQLVNTLSGQDRLMGEHLDDLRSRIAQLHCESAVNLGAEANRLRGLVTPVRIGRAGDAAPPPLNRPPRKEDCARPTGDLPYQGAQQRFWKNTGFIDATAAISAAWQRYTGDAKNFTALRERLDDIRCDVSNAVDLVYFTARTRGSTMLVDRHRCVGLTAPEPHSRNPPSAFATMNVMPQGDSVLDEYRFGKATAVWHRTNLAILDDLQTRLMAVECLQGALKDALRAAVRTRRLGDAIGRESTGLRPGTGPAAGTGKASGSPTPGADARPSPSPAACVARVDKPYVSTVPDWGDGAIMAQFITVEIHRQRWYDTALEDMQGRLARSRCEQRLLNDQMATLSDRLVR